MQVVTAKRKKEKTIKEKLISLPISSETALEVEKSKASSVRAAITRLHSETEIKFATEQIEGVENKEGWILVWRIK